MLGNGLPTIAGEDPRVDVLKVEERYKSSGVVNTSTLIKSGPGFLHCLTISENDAAPTAGTIDIYDNTAASGQKIFSWTLTTAVFNPINLFFNHEFMVGLYVAFTTTADVNVQLSYR